MIKGTVKDKFGQAIANVMVELKEANFGTVHKTLTDENGHFSFEGDGRLYPYLTAVKEYGTEYLEYWCRNVIMLMK